MCVKANTEKPKRDKYTWLETCQFLCILFEDRYSAYCNILKDLREMFNISRNIKYFHFLSGQSLHKFTKFTYRFNQN